MKPWHQFLQRKVDATETVRIGLVGKYVELQDAYKSIDESLLQAAIYNDRQLDLHLFHSEKLNDGNAAELLKDMDGILIAPGFGQRGIEGKFAALKYARENDVPCLGICLGMQCMVIEFARNVLGYADANSREMDEKTPHIHATIVPIVTGERRKAKKEEQNGKKKYRKKSTQDVRLCADDVMARHKLKHYQDTYAQAMGKYGLQRGIDGSLAKHISTMQYYKELIEQQDSLQENIETLLGLEEESQKRLKQV